MDLLSMKSLPMLNLYLVKEIDKLVSGNLTEITKKTWIYSEISIAKTEIAKM